jgi:DNA-binding XRE family transcriptional regulator
MRECHLEWRHRRPRIPQVSQYFQQEKNFLLFVSIWKYTVLLMRETAKRLRVLRAEHDITQSKVARKAGLNATRYWQIENGEGPAATDDERAAVAAALGVKVSEIAWPEFQKAQAS